MIAIINYGVGNLFSLQSSLNYLGADCVVTADPQQINEASHVIFPGVGAFGDAIEKLRAAGLEDVVKAQAASGKPLLGICLGMQLLYEQGSEYGSHKGLGLIPGSIGNLRDAIEDASVKVPHMGWNSLDIRRESPLLRYTKEGDAVYYVHSFYAAVSGDTVASSSYGGVDVTGMVQRGNVYGAQFHPEKSGKTGLAILQAFSEL